MTLRYNCVNRDTLYGSVDTTWRVGADYVIGWSRCISMDAVGVSVLAWRFVAVLNGSCRRPRLRRDRLVPAIEQAVQKEREPNDDKKAADADR